MKSFTFFAAAAAFLVVRVSAQSPVYGQCGGIGWTGATTCAAGSTCTVSNAYYSQCLPGSSPPATTTSPGTTTSKPSTTTSSAPAGSGAPGQACPGGTKFKHIGVNQSGAEFGNTVIPGTLGKDYTWPSPSSIDYFMGKGMNTFRITFLMERLVPPSGGIAGAFDSTYLSGLTTIVNYVTNKGGYAIVDPHNFMRYNNAVISSTSQFQTFWKNLAGQFKTNSKVIFDVMNEPNGIDAGVVAGLNQAAVNGIRSSGATTQLILLEGTAWTGAWSWTSSGNAAAFTNITDPNNNFAIQMHQYLDSDSSGTSPTCVSSTIGAQRVADATSWLKAHNLRGFLGEIGAGSNSDCISAVYGALCAMQQSGVWMGVTWWAAGPWWGTYFQSIEPPSGAAIPSILPQALMPFV